VIYAEGGGAEKAASAAAEIGLGAVCYWNYEVGVSLWGLVDEGYRVRVNNLPAAATWSTPVTGLTAAAGVLSLNSTARRESLIWPLSFFPKYFTSIFCPDTNPAASGEAI
jgi:hypothetical protein